MANPFNPNEPLGLPKGSVRALITLGIVGVVLALFALERTIPDQLLAAWGAVMLYYGLTRLSGSG